MGISFMKKLGIIIRKITIPPVFALVLLISVCLSNLNNISILLHAIEGVIFIAIFPVLAYPLQKHIPAYKDKGREGQRSLAIIFSFAGYSIAVIIAFLFKSPEIIKFIYLNYLFCGFSILLCDKVFKIKASGHACGVTGPLITMVYFKLYIPAIICNLCIICYTSFYREYIHEKAYAVTSIRRRDNCDFCAGACAFFKSYFLRSK